MLNGSTYVGECSDEQQGVKVYLHPDVVPYKPTAAETADSQVV